MDVTHDEIDWSLGWLWAWPTAGVRAQISLVTARITDEHRRLIASAVTAISSAGFVSERTVRLE